MSGLTLGHPLNYRDVQRAVQALFSSGQFDDVQITQTQSEGKNVLVIAVRERPMLVRWSVRGVEHLAEGSVRDKVQLSEGRPLDPAGVARARARIDSLYHAQGYYLAHSKPVYAYQPDSSAGRVAFKAERGSRVATAQVNMKATRISPTRSSSLR